MTRRKSVCLKWTLVLLVVIVCPSVYTRPQEVSPVATTNSALNEISTQAPIRYRFSNFSFNSFKLAPIVISLVNKTKLENKLRSNVSLNLHSSYGIHFNSPSTKSSFEELGQRNINTARTRTSRLIRTHETKKKHRPKPAINKNEDDASSYERKKPAIRKVITKWKDKTKYDDLNFSYEATTSHAHVKAGTTKFSSAGPNDDTSTETSSEMNAKRYTRPPDDMYYMYNNPRPQYLDESQVYSPHFQVIDTHPRPTRPPYYHTSLPMPTPIITNVGYPKPWTQQSTRKTTTQRPLYNTRPTNYEYHNNVQNYDGNNYEVSTFQPSNSYTDRIVIRPEEYSPSAEDCPTIYLTLNNTFQGQAKEACPDLNIAVNTNVINKNVVIESEEDGDTDSFFPEGFGLGLGDDSATDSSKDEDYFESEENQEQGEDSASVEGTELANYQSANSAAKPESAESGGFGAASSPSSALSVPGRPGSSDDDIFSFSSLIDFFRPALNVLGWLTTVNPLSIGLFPLLLAPIGLLFAGSGIAALFSPWILPYAREAPKVVHVYRPEWRWDDDLKTWHLHSFPNNRRLVPELGRASTENKDEGIFQPTLIDTMKEWMKNVTNKWIDIQNNYMVLKGRKLKRKKREAWTRRLKLT